MATAYRLAAWLKAKRKDDVTDLLLRAQAVSVHTSGLDRAWLSNDAPLEINDAAERKKLVYLIYPFAGIARWLVDPAARPKAEQVLNVGLHAIRDLMK